ncbi:unnamed protein product [Sphenostylis stenocarpa]|uniref:Uncharacterized protein n=1 Tax=Sphenostylis stenocarpa TaxID=92480 RepID=A0AA86SLY7_9FABA|nr:unnamed protein product [Sphenostylis stenocarpa]
MILPCAFNGKVLLAKLARDSHYTKVNTDTTTSLLRASRSKLASSTSASVSRTFSRSVPRGSPGSSPAVRSFGSAVPRWSHGVDWRSPLGLRPQIRAVAPLIERFHRRIATSGTLLLSPAILELCSFLSASLS